MPEGFPAGIDPDVPHIARVYNYWLGGKDNFPVDRELAERFIAADPGVIEGVRSNRAFLIRAVEFLTREAGIRQFLDIGTGIPAADNVHEVASRNAPGCRVLYVDNDPISISHGRTLLAEHPAEHADYIDADLRDPRNLLLAAAEHLDFSEPVGLMMLSVLHCIPDTDEPAGLVSELIEAVPAGSYVAISHPASDIHAEQIAAGSAVLNKSLSSPVAFRSHEKVLSFFNDLELVEPGLVTHSQWRPRPGADTKPYSSWAGVARK
jgi:hypothetical protein